MKLKNQFIISGALALMAGKVLKKVKNIRANAEASFNVYKDSPHVHSSAYIDSKASIIGQTNIGKKVYIGPFASIRSDVGLQIHVGDQSSVQDGVVLHGLQNRSYGSLNVKNSVFVENKPYSIYIGDRVTLAHQSQIHGPSWIQNDVFVGMQSLVFNSIVEKGVVIEPAAKVIGVTIPEMRFVPAGSLINDQTKASQLPVITPEYPYYHLNQNMVTINNELAQAYSHH